MRQTMRVIKVLAAIAMLGIAGVALLLVTLWLDHTRETNLPAPTGPFAVGRVMYHWSDTANDDSMAQQAGTKRELVAWIWYPALSQAGLRTADYFPAPWRAALAKHLNVLFTQFIDRDTARVHSHALQDAVMASQDKTFPVVIMRAGAAALVANYTTLAEDLASHGYVVVGFDAPYRSMITVFPDGRVIARAPQNNVELQSGQQQTQLAERLAESWSRDSSFALDQMEQLNASGSSGLFFAKLDLTRVGIFGHSLGGATALQFCHDDARCKAGIDVDGLPLGSVIAEGVTQPFMFLLSDHRGETADADTPEAIRQAGANIRSIY